MTRPPEKIGDFSLDVDSSGVAHLVSRPPVNAVSTSVYQALGGVVDRVEADEAIRVVVLSAPGDARAWCGGADLRDFVDIDVAGRNARYEFINAQLPRFFRMERPVIAAINGAAIGVGMILAGLCDMRVAAEDAVFGCPEIDYGLVAGGAAVFKQCGMPDAKVREMLYTGARFTGRALEPTGFFNYVVPRDQVVSTAVDLARSIVGKSLPALRARKFASTQLEGVSWEQAYLDAQALTAQLTKGGHGGEGAQAFLDKRKPSPGDL